MKGFNTVLREQIIFAQEELLVTRKEIESEFGYIPEGCNNTNEYYHYSRGFLDALKYLKSELG